jgi:uncharacterized phage protein (TIGR01671 family)
MRIIKFRAWDEKTKYMAYQGIPDLETLQSFIHHFCDKQLMQFTGLHDQNGKEIYEGDQFERNGHIGTVEYLLDRFVIRFDDDKIINLYADWRWDWQCSTAEVIGNIFEQGKKYDLKFTFTRCFTEEEGGQPL